MADEWAVHAPRSVISTKYKFANPDQRRVVMKTIAKLGMGVVLVCGLAAAATAPASAQVRFGVGINPPAVVPPPAYSCYDAYGNYVYSYPYCTAYPAPYVGPSLSFRFGDRDRDWRRFHDRDRDRGRNWDRSFDRGDHGDRDGDHH